MQVKSRIKPYREVLQKALTHHTSITPPTPSPPRRTRSTWSHRKFYTLFWSIWHQKRGTCGKRKKDNLARVRFFFHPTTTPASRPFFSLHSGACCSLAHPEFNCGIISAAQSAFQQQACGRACTGKSNRCNNTAPALTPPPPLFSPQQPTPHRGYTPV